MNYFGHRHISFDKSFAQISSMHTMLELFEEREIRAILQDAGFEWMVTSRPLVGSVTDVPECLANIFLRLVFSIFM